jgi:hypothetical protein
VAQVGNPREFKTQPPDIPTSLLSSMMVSSKEWIKSVITFREIENENLMPLKESADKTKMF